MHKPRKPISPELRAVPFIVRWMKTLGLDLTFIALPMFTEADDPPQRPALTICNLFHALANGLLLCRIQQKVLGRAGFPNDPRWKVHERPSARSASLQNIEGVLQFARGCSRTVHSSRLCTAWDVYQRDVASVLPCLLELLEIWKLQRVRMNAKEFLEDLNSVLLPYNREFLPGGRVAAHLFARPTAGQERGTRPGGPFDVIGLFASGIKIAILLTRAGMVDEQDLLHKMYGAPKTQKQCLFNLRLVLWWWRRRAPSTPILLRGPMEWLDPPAGDEVYVLAQFQHVWESVYVPNRGFLRMLDPELTFRDGVKLYIKVGDSEAEGKNHRENRRAPF